MSLSVKQFICALSLLTLSITVQAYERVVSTTGNASEVIAYLGLSKVLVGVDTTSTEPADVMEAIPKVGYRRSLSAEGILSLNPDLLILAPDAGPPNVLAQISVTKLPVITLKDDKSIDGVVHDIELIANALNAQEPAKALLAKIRREELAIKQQQQAYKRKPKIAVLMDGSTGRFTGLGKDTAGDGLVALVGGDNVFAAQFQGIKAISGESLIAEPADMIIFSTFSKDKKVTELSPAKDYYPAIALSQAGKQDCIFRIDASKALGFGPQVAQSAWQIAKAVNRCLP